ncbi:MAG: hypothetical protein ABL859_05355 [Methylotenera sp.]
MQNDRDLMPVSPGGTYFDNDELDALFKAVGFVVVQWGQAEQSLDLATGVLYKHLGGMALSKHLPMMLETKLKFIEKCFAKLPTLARFRADGEDLIADFRSLSATRHDLIHGAIASVSATNGGFDFMKLDFNNDDHVVREFRFEGEDFPKLTKNLIDLGARATTFAQ